VSEVRALAGELFKCDGYSIYSTDYYL